jgi:hypothetical protein
MEEASISGEPWPAHGPLDMARGYEAQPARLRNRRIADWANAADLPVFSAGTGPSLCCRASRSSTAEGRQRRVDGKPLYDLGAERKSHAERKKPTLDQMITDAAKLPPGPDAWAPIFEAFPGLTAEELVEKFREAAERDLHEAAELRRYLRQRERAADE